MFDLNRSFGCGWICHSTSYNWKRSQVWPGINLPKVELSLQALVQQRICPQWTSKVATIRDRSTNIHTTASTRAVSTQQLALLYWPGGESYWRMCRHLVCHKNLNYFFYLCISEIWSINWTSIFPDLFNSWCLIHLSGSYGLKAQRTQRTRSKRLIGLKLEGGSWRALNGF